MDLHRPEHRGQRELKQIQSFMSGLFPTVDFRIKATLGETIEESALDELAIAYAAARVKDPSKSEQSFEPMYGEVDYERRVLDGDAKAGGLVYEGRTLEGLFSKLLQPTREHASIIFTDRLISTYSRDDLRHHLRTIMFGFPSIVSIPGVVEAPAKPREYYLMMQELEAQGAGLLRLEQLKSSFKGRFIDYDDSRTSEVLKGLTLQAILFHLTLEPFCKDRDCRFFNAHWQEDLIHSQITSGAFCRRHERMLQKLGKRPQLAW